MAKILQGPAGLQGIENLKHCKMLDPLGQAWQNGNALAAQTPGRTTVNKLNLCGSLLEDIRGTFDFHMQ